MSKVRDIASAHELEENFNTKNGLIIDIRSLKKNSVPGLENAIALDLMSQHFVEYFSDITKDTPILLCCDDGSRSRVAIRILTEMGYKNLYHLKNGINRWEKQYF
jgi:rhodanese-related sulfurtransferase